MAIKVSETLAPMPSASIDGAIDEHRYDEFIGAFALLAETRGIPRMAGRIFAYLLVCEPPERTAAQLATAIGASRGSISGMTHLLMRAGLIERRTRRGERQAIYLVGPGSMAAVIAGATEEIRRARALSDFGLDLMGDRPPAARIRLQELRDIYRFFELTFPALVERWERERREGTA